MYVFFSTFTLARILSVLGFHLSIPTIDFIMRLPHYDALHCLIVCFSDNLKSLRKSWTHSYHQQPTCKLLCTVGYFSK